MQNKCSGSPQIHSAFVIRLVLHSCWLQDQSRRMYVHVEIGPVLYFRTREMFGFFDRPFADVQSVNRDLACPPGTTELGKLGRLTAVSRCCRGSLLFPQPRRNG
ncbi:hypothetical protein CEXT_48031 [Caerostris extrusa]|uniref:Uncharacterized protein n=1 Tax=Caerostris extrusa TaxID=172846 RepID=A0AAV4TTN8_CAEEX|nr:hypothetical protein CEXT_48031 [Caerostris extrusa]